MLTPKENILPSQQPLIACSSSSRGGALWNLLSTWHVDKYSHYKVLFQQPYWDFVGPTSLTSRRCYTAAVTLSLWILQPFWPLIPSIPSVLVQDYIRCASWDWSPMSTYSLLFWPIVDLPNSLCCKRKLLWWGMTGFSVAIRITI